MVTDTAKTGDVLSELRDWLGANWDPDLTVGDWWERLGLAGWAAHGDRVEEFAAAKSEALVAAEASRRRGKQTLHSRVLPERLRNRFLFVVGRSPVQKDGK